MMLTRLAPADAGAGTPGVELLLFALPILLLFGVLVASRRRQREADARQAAIAVGDQVVTASGMLGRLVAFQGDVARLEVAPGVVVEFDRRAVISTVPAPDAEASEPAGATTAPKKEQ